VPGLIVQVPDGRLLRTTLPAGVIQVGWVIGPTVGAEDELVTFNVYVAEAAAHGRPSGLSVVTVIITVLPSSAAAGVYVNANGDVPEVVGVTEPPPLYVIVTDVAFVNVLPLIIAGVVPQVLPLKLLKVRVGPLVHPHDTKKLLPVVVQPEAFLTVTV
jgi:hypothetical protein